VVGAIAAKQQADMNIQTALLEVAQQAATRAVPKGYANQQQHGHQQQLGAQTGAAAQSEMAAQEKYDATDCKTQAPARQP
jgi:hypothetical protein